MLRVLLRLVLLAMPRGVYLLCLAAAPGARRLRLDPRPGQPVNEALWEALRSPILYCIAVVFALLWSSPTLVRLPGIVWLFFSHPVWTFWAVLGIAFGFVLDLGVFILALLAFRLIVLEFLLPQGVYFLLRKWAVESAMLPLGLIFVSPCLLALLNAFKTNAEIIRDPLALPEQFTWDNFKYIFTGMKLARPLLNSLLMCAGVIVSLVTIAPMAAYSIMRRQMATGKLLRVFFLIGLTVPFQIIMVPLLKLFHLMGIEYTYLALLLHYVSWGLPLCIFIYGAFMATIPRELEEAAAIDGCGQVATFWRIVFPLLTPCTVTVVIFWGLWIWNDFMQAFIVMGPTRGQLVFVQLWKFLNDQYVKNWNHIFAGVVVLSLPVTVLYVVMQRRFVKGLTAGAIK